MVIKDRESFEKYLGSLGEGVWRKLEGVGKILDVGCARGEFFDYLKGEGLRESRMYGVEKNVQWAEKAKNKGYKVVVGDVKEELGWDGLFEVVFLWDVLEHVEEPVKLLEKVEKRLTGRGMVVISTPNLEALSRKIQGESWYGYKDKTHRRFFDRKSLKKLMERIGLQVREMKTVSDSAWEGYNKLIGKTPWGGQLLVVGEKREKRLGIYNIGVVNSELLAKKIDYWQKQGWKVEMVCPDWLVEELERLVQGVRFLVVKSEKVESKGAVLIEMIKRSRRARRWAGRMRQWEVIYSVSASLDELIVPWGVRVGGGRGRWVVLFENEVYWRRPERWWVRGLAMVFYWLSIVLMRRADRIIVISDFLRDRLVEKGFDEGKLLVGGNGVDKEMIRKAREEVEMRKGGLFMGRIDESKGVFDLVEIVERVVEESKDFVLKVAGEGEERVVGNLKNKIKEKGLEENFEFLGYIEGERKYEELASCEVFVFPSYRESFGVALLEAVCSGAVGVVYDLVVYEDIYESGEIVRVGKGEAGEMAEAVLEELEKGWEKKRGRRLLESEEYDWGQIAKLEMEGFGYG